MATSFFASALAMARMARCTEERGISVTSEIMRTLRPAFIRSSTIRQPRILVCRGRLPLERLVSLAGVGLSNKAIAPELKASTSRAL